MGLRGLTSCFYLRSIMYVCLRVSGNRCVSSVCAVLQKCVLKLLKLSHLQPFSEMIKMRSSSSLNDMFTSEICSMSRIFVIYLKKPGVAVVMSRDPPHVRGICVGA